MRITWFAAGLLMTTVTISIAAAQPTRSTNLGGNRNNTSDAPEISPNVPADENQAAPNDAPQRPTVTQQTAFTIPYSVDPAFVGEVQLMVSTNQGKKWEIYRKQRPEMRRFNFRASGDGEYWFVSRTIDALGRANPAGQLQPQLKIVIDTHPPKFELSANVSPTGEIKTAWNIFDPALAPESFKLEYRPTSSQVWLSIFSEPPPADSRQGLLVGEHSFTPRSASLVVDLRGEVRDEAGNIATSTKRVTLPRGFRPAGERTAEKPVEGLLSGLAGLVKGPAQSIDSTDTPPDPFATRRPAPLDTSDNSSSTAGGSAEPTSLGVPGGLSAPNDASNSPLTIPRGGIPAVVAGPTLSNGSNAAPPTQEWLPSKPPTGDRAADVRQYPPTKMPTHPPVANRFASSPREPAETGIEELPTGEKPSFTSARHFNLDYDTDAVGPSGVSSVELWGTSDGGRTWTKWGVDTDKQSPIRVDVEEDGTYGFCVVVESGLGLTGPRPHSGDPADMWVTVDGSKPKARFTSASFGSAEIAGQLDIRWEATDENLSSRPISLAFAEQAEGPWTTIAAGLPNNGRYLWNADPRLPRLIYLRIEVRDEAGNVGEHQLSEPISTEGLSPKGRIRGVRPIDDNTQGAAGKRVVR